MTTQSTEESQQWHRELSEEQCVSFVGQQIKGHYFKYTNESELQDGIELILKNNNIEYCREDRLNAADIVDFTVPCKTGLVAIEVKIDGGRSKLLRQIGRYLKHDHVACVFVVGSRHWVTNLPDTLLDKQIYCHKISTGIF